MVVGFEALPMAMCRQCGGDPESFRDTDAW